MKSLIDNDILVKGSCYGLLRELASTLPGDAPVGILGAANFVVPKLIRKKRLRRDQAAAETVFLAFARENKIAEPTLQEQVLAAELEALAQTLAVNLDVGESQLAAILITRAVPFLATGDKRAITAMERLLDADHRVTAMTGRLKCLEQLVRTMLGGGDPVAIRRAICAEPEVDKTLNACFACASAANDTANVLEGLQSYIAEIRASARRVLAN